MLCSRPDGVNRIWSPWPRPPYPGARYARLEPGRSVERDFSALLPGGPPQRVLPKSPSLCFTSGSLAFFRLASTVLSEP